MQNKIIESYDMFVKTINELGLMQFGNSKGLFPSLSEMTLPDMWHAASENDPWQWKDKIAEEKKAAYGKFFNCKPAFCSMKLYPYLIAAKRPSGSIDDLYKRGEVSPYFCEIYNVIKKNGTSNLHKLKKEISVSKEDKSKFEKTVEDLQNYMYITVCGKGYRVNSFGIPYGWGICEYQAIEDYAPEIFSQAEELDRDEAVKYLIDHFISVSNGIDQNKASKYLGIK